MEKHVKGVLFLDYVRMIRKRKQVDWNKYLKPEDFKIVNEMILPSQWYPLASFQRMGVAVLKEIAKGDMQVVRSWGRKSMDEIAKIYKNLVETDEPLRTLERFRLLRSRFFDFGGLEIESLAGNSVNISLDMAFEDVAEEAYAYQMLGSFERLLEMAGAGNIEFKFERKRWAGDPRTIIRLSWE